MRVLVDCGEAAQHRLFAARIPPNSIDAVCCTHLHGDHVLGLPGLLGTMGMDDRRRPLRLIGPTGLSDLIDGLAATPALTITIPLELEEHDPALLSGQALTHLTPISEVSLAIAPLDHRVPTIGFRFEAPDAPGSLDVARLEQLGVPQGPLLGRLQRGEPVSAPDGSTIRASDVTGPVTPGASVAFAYDTRPCEGARTLAAGVDLLVHEATFAQSDASLADKHGHSTALDAAHIAEAAHAKRLLLTHFSSRYDTIEGLLDEARARFPETSVAEELLWVDVIRPGSSAVVER